MLWQYTTFVYYIGSDPQCVASRSIRAMHCVIRLPIASVPQYFCLSLSTALEKLISALSKVERACVVVEVSLTLLIPFIVLQDIVGHDRRHLA